MNRVILFALVALGISACGGPMCESAIRESAFVSGCVNPSTTAQCQCAWDYLADRHTCDQIDDGDISMSVIYDAAEACSG